MIKNKFILFALLAFTLINAEDILLDRIEAIVGDRPILHSEIKKGLDFIESSPFYGVMQKDSLKTDYVNHLINKQIMYKIAEQESILIDSFTIMKDVRDYIEETLKNNFPDENAYNDFLVSNDLSAGDLEKFYFEQREASFIKQQILFRKGIMIDVTKNDVERYYEENKDSFFIPLTFDLYHIAFVLQPDSMKYMSIMQKVDALVRSLQTGTSFKEIAVQYSDDEISRKNGGLISYTKYEDIKPDMATFLYAYMNSDTLLYTQSRQGFHIIKIDTADTKGVQYRQILVSFNISAEDSLRIKNKAQAVRNKILSGELTFKDAASQYSDDYASAVNGGFIGNIPVESVQGSIHDVLNDLEDGEISGVEASDFGYEIFMIDNKRGGIQSELEDVKGFIRSILEGKQIEKKVQTIIDKEKENLYIKRIDE